MFLFETELLQLLIALWVVIGPLGILWSLGALLEPVVSKRDDFIFPFPEQVDGCPSGVVAMSCPRCSTPFFTTYRHLGSAEFDGEEFREDEITCTFCDHKYLYLSYK